MRKKSKNIYDECSVDVIPEGKENEYYSEEESLIIKKKIIIVARFTMLFSIYLFILMIIVILKTFIEFPQWLKILTYIIVGSGMIVFMIGVIKYARFLKFAKEKSQY